LITAASLKPQTSKDLAQLAKKKGIPGWHSMRKAQLVGALVKLAKDKEKQKAKTSARAIAGSREKAKAKPIKTVRIESARTGTSTRTPKRPSRGANKPQVESAIAKKIRSARVQEETRKNLAFNQSDVDRIPEQDRIVLIVRDAFWVQAYWEITRASVQRAKAALAENWHRAKPALRLLEVSSSGNTNSVETTAQEVIIHGGVNNWFLSVNDGSKSYRMAIGYLVEEENRFHLIAKSNQIMMPGAGDAEDCTWTDITNDAERFYTLSGGHDDTLVSGDLRAVIEEKARKPMEAPVFQRLGSAISPSRTEFPFSVNAHMVVYGATTPSAKVTIAGDPIRIEGDGSFALKMDLPDKRQVLPIVASNRDGTQRRTTVLAIERNTKVMEPLTLDLDQLED
jgi:hypothetical protein